MQRLYNKDRTTTLIAVVAIVLFFWIIFPQLTLKVGNGNGVNGEMEMETVMEEEMTPAEAEEAFAENGGVNGQAEVNGQPAVQPQTGAIMDGPGYEAGPIQGAYADTPSGIPSNYYFLDDGAGGQYSIQHNLCSKSCCSQDYPTPFKKKYDAYVCGNKSKFIPSNIMCNNTFQDSGCLCLTKDQGRFLYNRGGNGREWF